MARVEVFTLDEGADQDANNLDALSKGYDKLHTFAAIGKTDRKIYGLYEFYSREDIQDDFLTKAIDIDCNFQKMGIGKAFLASVRDNGIKARPSGKYTAAGAALLNSLRRPGKRSPREPGSP